MYDIVFPDETHVAQDFLLCGVWLLCFVSPLKIPNIAKKLEDFKKDVEAKKKPPNDKSWKYNVSQVNSVCAARMQFTFEAAKVK